MCLPAAGVRHPAGADAPPAGGEGSAGAWQGGGQMAKPAAEVSG